MKLSIVIPTFNEEKYIVDCISSLLKQSYNDFEVIIVEDGSTDKTLDRLAELARESRIRFYEQKHKGPAEARNVGAKHARGEILIFVDADMTFDKKFLQMLIAPIKAGKAKGTWSRDEYVSNWDNVWARCWNINQNLPPKRRLPKSGPATQKVFRAILKKEFARVGGFDKGGYTDDYSLSTKLGYQAIVASHAFFYHKNPDTLSEVFKQAKWVAKRKYKFGIVGIVVTFVRNSLPFAIVMGFTKAIFYREPRFVLFKLAYATAVTIGLCEMLFKKKLLK